MSVSPTETEVRNGADESVSADEGRTAESPAANEGAKADSPTADQGVKETLVDRIKKAADSVTESSPGSEGSEGEQADPTGKPNGELEEEAKPFTKEDLPNLHSKTRKRVEKLLATVDSVAHERDALKPAAEAYQGVVGFLKENGLSMEDANTAFDIMRDINHNPELALQKLQPIVQQLMQMTGAVLPDDLAQQVQQGYISEQHASEIARHRADKVRHEARQQEQQTEAQRRQVEVKQQAARHIEQAVSGWESQWASSDPDYQKKRDAVHRAIKAELADLQRGGKLPKSAAEAVEVANRCRKWVEDQFGVFRPQKQEVRHVTGSSAVTHKPAAKSLEEAILHRVNG